MQRAICLMKCYTGCFKNSLISLPGLVAVIILFWGVIPIEDLDLYLKVVITLIYVGYLVFILIDDFRVKQQDRKFDPSNFVATIIPSSLLVILVVDRANMPVVGVNVLSILASLLPFWILWRLTKGKRLLQLAAIPLIFITLVYLIPPITLIGLSLFLVPLPVVLCVLIVWALAARGTLALAQRWRRSPVWGPLTESLTMLLIAAPLVALTMLAANAMGFGDIGVAVFGVIAGILFGNAVSAPLRQFLLALGDLSQKCRCEGEP